MKKIILTAILFFPLLCFCQMVVNDPVLATYAAKEAAERTAMTSNTVKQLSEAYKHTQELSKSTDFLQKNYDRLTTVNTFISNLSRLDYMIEKQQGLISTTTEIIEELETSDLYTLTEVNALHSSLTKMITGTNSIVSMLDIILKPKSKMSDAERLSLLREMEKEFKERQAIMDKTIWQYTRIRNQRMVNQTLQTIHAKE